MNRRDVSKLLGAAAAVAALQPSRGTQVRAQSVSATPPASGQIGMLVFPGMTVLDLIGPQQYFAVAPGRTTHLLWKTRDAVVSDSGVPILPTATFAEAPEELEILFVPGGFQGTGATIGDPDVLDFVAGGGVTSGIDFGLTLLARLAGEDYARGWQLGTEYDPHPPFDAGTPDKAGQFIEGEVLKVLGPRVEHVRGALAGTPGYVGG
jgi:hypothetical protein